MSKYYTVRHSIQGRLRIKITAAAGSITPLSKIEHEIRNLKGIFFTRCNTACRSIVITYDKTVLNAESILHSLNAFFLSLPEQKTVSCQNCRKCTVKTDQDLIKPARRRFTLLSAVMAGTAVQKLFFRTAAAQGLFSPLGIVCLAFSLPLIKEAYENLKQKKLKLDGFLGAGCIASVISGQALTALEILWINSGAELLQAWITERSRKSIADILDKTTHHTFKLIEGIETEIPVTEVKQNDIVVFHTGEKICVDGEIIDGSALIDESPITGRTDFIPKNIGDCVLAGTFIRQGIVYVSAQKVGDETYLSRILCQVENNLRHKAPIEEIADRLANNLVRLGFVSTAVTFVLTQSFWRAFTVLLVMACPCATVLAAGTAISAGMNNASNRKILVKGGKYLESVGKADCVCFDKTGTLTTTEPELVHMSLLKDSGEYHLIDQTLSTEDAFLQMLYSAEIHNHHPLALAIIHKAKEKNISPIAHTQCEYFLGMGVSATVLGNEILIGNAKMMRQFQIDISCEKSLQEQKNAEENGQTLLFAAKNRELVGLLTFDNIMRENAQVVIRELRRNGIKHIYLITGDERPTAQKLCRQLGIEHFYSSVMPEEKGGIVKELQKKHKSVIMIGDGINDAMALSQANIGIAMGEGGSDIAVESADITLVDDNLSNIVYVHSLSKQTIKTVRQNFWIATGSNLLGLVLAGTGVLSPFAAGVLHIAHTAGVLANSARLLRYKGKNSI